MENDFFSYGYNNKNLPSFLDEKTTQGMLGRIQSYKDKGLYDAFKKEDTDKDENKFTRFAGDLAKEFGGGFQPYDAKSEYLKGLLKRPFGGGAIPGSSTRLGGGLSLTRPPAFAPIITPAGGVGGPQGRSTGQRIAGAAMGALSGAGAGAALGAKIGTAAAPGIGTAIGAGIGLLGGLFG